MRKLLLAGICALTAFGSQISFIYAADENQPHSHSLSPAPSPAPSRSTSGTPAVEIMRKHIDIDVNSDGSFTQHSEVLLRVLSQQGVEALRQTSLAYSEPNQKGDILEAYTLKPNGTRIDVPRDKIMEGYGATTAAGFYGTKTKSAYFQNVEVGDEVGTATKIEQTIPWYPGQFEDGFAFGKSFIAHDVQVTLTAPADLAMKFDVVGLEGGTPENSGRKVRRTWTFHNDAPETLEAGSVQKLDNIPHFIVSTFPDFASIGAQYAKFSHDKALPNVDIKALAEQLTAGVTDRKEQVHRLYDWVSKNIKYVAIVLGNGGLVPHQSAEVLRNRFGDCKDHDVLLRAFLAAKGIDSTPVLINAASPAELPGIAYSGSFDHVITYIPEFDLYLDSTAKYAPFGVLPNMDSDRPVLIVATGAVTRTSPVAASNTQYNQITSVNINADGSASGETHVTATGEIATEFRATMSAIVAGREQDYLRATTPSFVDGGYTRDDPSALIDPYSIDAHYTLTGVLALPGPKATYFTIGFHPIYLTGIVAPGWQNRQTAYLCPSLSAHEETTITFPAVAHIMFVPKGGNITTEDINVSMNYERIDAHTLKETLALNVAHPHLICTADYYNRVRGDLSKVSDLLNAQILYK